MSLHDVTFADGSKSRVGEAWIDRWPEDILEVDGEPFAQPGAETEPENLTAPEPEPEAESVPEAPATADPEPEPTEEPEAAPATTTPTTGRKRGK